MTTTTADKIMEQAIAFARAHALVADAFDDGEAKKTARLRKFELAASVYQMQKDRDDLTAELELAHRIIRNGYGFAMSDKKSEWGKLNWRDGIPGQDPMLMRANEREALIKRVKGARNE